MPAYITEPGPQTGSVILHLPLSAVEGTRRTLRRRTDEIIGTVQPETGWHEDGGQLYFPESGGVQGGASQ
ncbi:MAG TPA: hypothetical protein VGX00_08515 [Thermoplasmata archaeon]|nr:hypothetical protein [Thermoplasmata archaeon]